MLPRSDRNSSISMARFKLAALDRARSSTAAVGLFSAALETQLERTAATCVNLPRLTQF